MTNVGMKLFISIGFFILSGVLTIERINQNDVGYLQHPYASTLGSIIPGLFGAIFVYFVLAPYFIRRFEQRWVRCPHCDSLISARAKVCPRCHRDIKDVDASSATTRLAERAPGDTNVGSRP